MQELTMREMSEIEGREWGWRNFFEGFACGAGIIASLAITPTTSLRARWSIYSATMTACGVMLFD